MKVIGLTGGIASGKTTVSDILKGHGAVIIDADKISRKIFIKDSPVYKEVVKEFGNSVLKGDGEIDRKKLGNIVFNDYNKLKKLNEITHPVIIEDIKEKIEKERSIGKEKAVILDAALLIESKLYEIVDEVWLIVVDTKTQIDRLMERDKLSYEDAANRIKSQMPIEDKMKHADFLINNCRDINTLKKQIDLFWERFALK
ncbi:dephospho-CoA kinase [Aceticella autotrophica]|uniref:Dephospho-CoA kinase n=1 Tax=Aceticella autotrophica TaxID=2755338 RepID=A0A975AWU5_9THEO|nr:dephospho-CoA kinase [Aceticella autotrophica]QSZ27861.1 dephospho-CoA kinase [Aceticella autotrophica]